MRVRVKARLCVMVGSSRNSKTQGQAGNPKTQAKIKTYTATHFSGEFSRNHRLTHGMLGFRCEELAHERSEPQNPY